VVRRGHNTVTLEATGGRAAQERTPAMKLSFPSLNSIISTTITLVIIGLIVNNVPPLRPIKDYLP
jgi:hypothetical protein